jgi:hypothetical protein
MKKTITTSFFALFLITIMLGSVFGLEGTSSPSGNGVWTDRNGGIFKDETECSTASQNCREATPTEVANNPIESLANQEKIDAMNDEQKKAIAKKHIKDITGLEVIGEDLNDIELNPNQDGDLSGTFKYKGHEVEFADLKEKANMGYKNLDLSTDLAEITGPNQPKFTWNQTEFKFKTPETAPGPVVPVAQGAPTQTTPTPDQIAAAQAARRQAGPQARPQFPQTAGGQAAQNLGGQAGQGNPNDMFGLISQANQMISMWAQYINPAKDSIVKNAQESNAKASQGGMKTQGNMAGGVQRGDGSSALAFQGGATPVNENEATLDDGTVFVADSGAGGYVGYETYLTNQGSNTDAFNAARSGTTATTTAISLPLLNILSKLSLSIIPSVTAQITGNAISDTSGQYITFEQDDLDFNGREIEIYALKTFDEIKAGGQDLDFYSANFRIKFDQQRIYTNRLQPNAPFGANIIQNKLDQNTEFRLQHYTDKKGDLSDKDKRVTITDITTNHPKEQLTIAKIRKNMWK